MEDNYIGEKIREIRKRNGLSQEEFAYRINVAKQTVSCWELGTIKPNFQKIKIICEVFKVSADSFVESGEEVCSTNTQQSIDKIENSNKVIQENTKLLEEAEVGCTIVSNQDDDKTSENQLKQEMEKPHLYRKQMKIGFAISFSLLIVGLIFILSTSIFTTNVGIVTTQSSHWQIPETFNIVAYVISIISFVLVILFIIKIKRQNKNKNNEK